MLKKIDHHMLYMSARQNDRNSAVSFRQNIERENGRGAVHRLSRYSEVSVGRGAGVNISSLNNSKRELQSYSIQAHPYNLSLKPLQDNSTRVSFKGFNFGKVLEPVVEEIPQTLSSFVLKSMKSISGQQLEMYTKSINDFVTAVKTDKGFQRYLGITEDAVKNVSEQNLIKIPQKSLVHRTFSVLVSPFTAVKDMILWGLDNSFGKKLFPALHKRMQETKRYDALVANYKGVVGLSNFTRIQENNYRRMSGHGDWLDGKDMIIPEDIIKEKLMSQKLRTVDPEKGQYSAKHLMLGNRLVSGTVYAGFLSNDAYNTTMRYSNDENASQEQRASRAKQEVAKIGMNMYVHNLLLSMFESQINKSMFHALLASGVTVAAAEVMGRVLVGRPIFPSDKESLDRMEEKMQNKKGVMAAVGRLIAGDKRNSKPAQQTTQKQDQVTQQSTLNNTFGNFDMLVGTASFSSRQHTSASPLSKMTSATPSFKGLMKTPKYVFDRGRLQEMMSFIKKLDPDQYNFYEQVIKKALTKDKNIDAAKIEGKTLDAILSDTSIKEIALGENKTFTNRFVDGFFSPVSFVKDTVTSIFKGVKKLFGAGEDKITREMLDEVDFQKYLEERLKLPVWKTSPLEPDEKELKIYKEFVARAKHNGFEANAVKNLILTLEKRFNTLGIDPKSEEFENLQKAKEIFNKLLTRADGVNHTEYDGNSIAQLNINLARAISTIFLVTDSYNLTMQYSNDNKKEAIKTAKNRAAQEVSRIASSAYIMAFTHRIISKVYNGSLLGAFSTVLLTSVASDSMARAVVGVPILRKSQAELIEMEEKQQETKNPVRKTLAYLIGKKVN